MERTSAELVAQARRGDKDAFGCLIERYEGMVTRLASRMIAEQAVARELVQEAFVQSYLSLDHLRDAARFESWLYGITLNVCRNYLRDQKAQALSLDGIDEALETQSMDGASDPQSIAEEREMRRHVLRAVMGLSPGERAATLLFYYEQHTIQEIAQSLSISVTAVKGRLHRARNQLRAQLAALYEVLPQERREQRKKREQIKQREKRKKVSKQHMRPVTIASVREHPTTQQHVVILKDDTDRKLTIWIGKPEAWAIASGLQGVEMPRPMTAQLMLKLLEATGATLEEVRIDALSLAVLVKCPIYAADEVMERVNQCPSGRDLPPIDAFRIIDRAAIEQDQEEHRAALAKVISEMAELSAHQHKLEQEQAKQKQIDERKAGQEGHPDM